MIISTSQFQMKTLIIFLFLSIVIHSQSYRLGNGDDLVFSGHSYKTVVVSIRSENEVYRKQWLAEDLKPTEISGVMDMETQRGLMINGHFINGTIDSIYVNIQAALKSCPEEWRIPRIGEWDTLLSTITMEHRRYMFQSLPGYIGYNSSSINDSIIINKNQLSGGFWWSSTFNDYWVEGIELDFERNLHFGKAPLWDRASIRCVKDL